MKVVKLPPPATQTPAQQWPDVYAFLDDLRASIERGDVDPSKMMLFWVEKNANGSLRPHYWVIGMGIAEQIAYAELIKTEVMEDWRDG